MFRALAEMVSFDFIGGPFGTVTPRFHLLRYLVSITAAVGILQWLSVFMFDNGWVTTEVGSKHRKQGTHKDHVCVDKP